MADEIENQQYWANKLRELQLKVSHIPYAAEQTRDDAIPVYQEIEDAYQNGNLTPDLENLWETHKSTLQQITQFVDQFVADWGDNFAPVFKKRPPE